MTACASYHLCGLGTSLCPKLSQSVPAAGAAGPACSAAWMAICSAGAHPDLLTITFQNYYMGSATADPGCWGYIPAAE